MILRTIRESTGLRFTLVARVLPDRWVACAVHDDIEFGLKAGGELDVATTLCSTVRDTLQPVAIDEVKTDLVYKDHQTPKLYGFESYIAVPIFRQSGEYFGNVCGLDPLPNKVNDSKTLSMMRLFAQLISLQLEAEERHEGGRIELDSQRETSKLREQFIAVLGHDVRNPLTSITMGTEMLIGKSTDTGERRTLERIRSSARRIGALVDDVLDLARGRLGNGITLETAVVDDLPVRLRHVIAEVQAAHPTRAVDTSIDLAGTVRCDAKRIEQLLSNLLANAIEHGAPGTPITVSVTGDERTFKLEVSNQGAPISEDARDRLFQPYFRGGQTGRSDGLGLGLYIVSEIARSHGGLVDVQSSAAGTVFSFSMRRLRNSDPG
jgi:signal transduction histidine kinase